jgi:hypothetical protein
MAAGIGLQVMRGRDVFRRRGQHVRPVRGWNILGVRGVIVLDVCRGALLVDRRVHVPPVPGRRFFAGGGG